MIIQGNRVTGTVLTAMEFRDLLYARYNVNPPNLQNKYDGCLHTFYVLHALRYINRVLAITLHNEICDDIIQLSR